MKLIVAATLAVASFAAVAQTYVQPHVRRDGTYVEGHFRSAPDSNRLNNYSSQGNFNPYTGERGTVNPYQPIPAPTYIQPNPYGQQQRNPYNPYGR